MKVALDHDSTLAATWETAFNLLCGDDHGYTYDDLASWDWGLDHFGESNALHALWHAWTIRPLSVPLMDETVVETAQRLYDEHEVHVVTAQPPDDAVAGGKRRWLDHHGIPYDAFDTVPTGQTKAELDYDVFIDDKPTLPSKTDRTQAVFLRDQPYNRNVDEKHIRIHQLDGVVGVLCEAP